MERTSFEADTEVLLIKPQFYAKFITSQILILMASMEKKNLHYLKKKMGKQIISALSFSPATFFSLFDSEK